MFNLLRDKVSIKLYDKWYSVSTESQFGKKYQSHNYLDCSSIFPDGVPLEINLWEQTDPTVIRFLEFMRVSKWLGIE